MKPGTSNSPSPHRRLGRRRRSSNRMRVARPCCAYSGGHGNPPPSPVLRESENEGLEDFQCSLGNQAQLGLLIVCRHQIAFDGRGKAALRTASSAIRRRSRVPKMTLPFQAATPRLTTSQQAFTAHPPGTLGSNDHSNWPVTALSANTLLQAVVKYMMPSTTTGVASCSRCVSRSKYQARPSWETL